jgi:hypothetical protein
MFQPNLVGTLKRLTGRDVHSRETWSDPIDCPFGPVNLDVGSQKTSVRSDSSASRGAADEIATMNAKILIAPFVQVAIGDRFEFDGMIFKITTKHTRRSVTGVVDHFECAMEIVPA